MPYWLGEWFDSNDPDRMKAWRRLYCAKYYADHKEYFRAKSKEYLQKNPEKAMEYQRKYHAANPEKAKSYKSSPLVKQVRRQKLHQRYWADAAYRERVKTANRAYYQANKDLCKAKRDAKKDPDVVTKGSVVVSLD